MYIFSQIFLPKKDGVFTKILRWLEGHEMGGQFFLTYKRGAISFRKARRNFFSLKEFQEIKPKQFIPILGSSIVVDPKHPYEKNHVFKIIYANSDTEILLATRSETDTKIWIKF